MHEVLEEESRPKSLSEKYIGLSTKSLVIISALVIIAGIYIGILLFGNNSLEAYIQLQEYHENMQERVETLKKENSQMQKEYFELKEITSGE